MTASFVYCSRRRWSNLNPEIIASLTFNQLHSKATPLSQPRHSSVDHVIFCTSVIPMRAFTDDLDLACSASESPLSTSASGYLTSLPGLLHLNENCSLCEVSIIPLHASLLCISGRGTAGAPLFDKMSNERCPFQFQP